MQHLGAPNGVLVLDETGFLNQGHHSAGGARQERGTVGKVDNCQSGVLLSYASPLGYALLDRALDRPQEWTDDRERGRQGGMPEDRHCATKPQVAQPRLARALAAGVPATWGTGDSVYGDNRPWRQWLEAPPQASVLAVSGQDYGWLGAQPRQVNTLLARLPVEGWTRLRAGDGAKGPRWDDWRWVSLAEPVDPTWRRWWLVRRSLSEPTDLTAYVVFAPPPTTLAAVVRVAGSRGTVESSCEAAKGEVGLDQSEVRSWTAWYRPITLAMWALARLTVMRAGTMAVEAFKNSRRSPQETSPLAAFKARRGLASHGASPSGGGCWGGECWPCPKRPATCWPGRSGVGGTSPSRSITTIRVGKHLLARWLPNHLVTTVVLGIRARSGKIQVLGQGTTRDVSEVLGGQRR